MASISAIVKQSWTSTTFMSFGLSLASLYALSAAIWVALSPVIESLSARLRLSVAWVLARILIGVSLYFFAISSGASITAAAPSEIGEQSKTLSGSATGLEFITSS